MSSEMRAGFDYGRLRRALAEELREELREGAPSWLARKYAGNPVLKRGAPGTFDELGAWHATIVYINGRYYMFYTASCSLDTASKLGLAKPNNIAVASADSPLGPWTKHGIVVRAGPQAWETLGGGIYVNPGSAIIGPDGRLWLYYFNGSEPGNIGIAYCSLDRLTDPTAWSKEPTNPVLSGTAGTYDSRRCWNPSLIITPGPTYNMIYHALDDAGVRTLALATSTDGKSWTKRGVVFRRGLPFGATWQAWDYNIEAHHVVRYADWFILVYEGAGVDGAWTVGLAYSKDLYVWAKCPYNPILKESWREDAFDRGSVCVPFLLLDEAFPLPVIYYSGIDRTGSFSEYGAAFLNPEALQPERMPSLAFELWRGRAVPTAGDYTPAAPTKGFKRKTFILASDQGGTVEVRCDPAGTGGERTLKTTSFASAFTYFDLVEYGFEYARMRFTPSAAATVDAYLVLEK